MWFFKSISAHKVRSKQDKGLPVKDFFGGVHPPENKSQSNLKPIKQLPLFSYYSIPLHQHIGQESELIIKIGERVQKGQPLTVGVANQVPVHAPTSGVVKAIVKQPSTDYFGKECLAVLIESDGKDIAYPQSEFDYLNATPQQIIDEIHKHGIAGLGGACFPTAVKLNHQEDNIQIDTIIINAAECEPYITADDRLMREYADDLIRALDIIRKVIHPKRILVGIEDNKPEAISAWNSALENTHIDLVKLATKVIVVPTKYPSGGAKQLITLLTGQEVPSGKHASDLGIIMLNVGTLFAIKKAIIDREPLIERVVTVTGRNFTNNLNYWMRIGTPINALLDYLDFDKTILEKRPLIMGGPMMGYPISPMSSVVKATNCLLSRSEEEFNTPLEEQPCIRCGECANVCPAKLLPQQLFWFSQGKELEKARDHHLFDCIECGACEYVCPSHIPLVTYYKVAKTEIKTADAEAKLAAEAKLRYEAKLARLEAEKIAREQRHKQLSTEINDKDKSAVEAAIARVKAKKAQSEANPSDNNIVEPATSASQDTQVIDNQLPQSDKTKSAVQAAVERARAKRMQTQSKKADADTVDTTAETSIQATVTLNDSQDPRKLAVQAAIDRAKAKRAAASSEDSAIATEKLIEPPSDKVVKKTAEAEPRKAAVEAALERAKAKRAAIQTATTETQASHQPVESKLLNDDSQSLSAEDVRKKAVQQAIDKAKARRASIQSQENKAMQPQVQNNSHANTAEILPSQDRLASNNQEQLSINSTDAHISNVFEGDDAIMAEKNSVDADNNKQKAMKEAIEKAKLKRASLKK